MPRSERALGLSSYGPSRHRESTRWKACRDARPWRDSGASPPWACRCIPPRAAQGRTSSVASLGWQDYSVQRARGADFVFSTRRISRTCGRCRWHSASSAGRVLTALVSGLDVAMKAGDSLLVAAAARRRLGCRRSSPDLSGSAEAAGAGAARIAAGGRRRTRLRCRHQLPRGTRRTAIGRDNSAEALT